MIGFIIDGLNIDVREIHPLCGIAVLWTDRDLDYD